MDRTVGARLSEMGDSPQFLVAVRERERIASQKANIALHWYAESYLDRFHWLNLYLGLLNNLTTSPFPACWRAALHNNRMRLNRKGKKG